MRAPWIIGLLALSTAMAQGDDGSVSFVRDVAPILNKQCANCHGAKKAKGGYRLHTFENLMMEGSSKKPPVTPGADLGGWYSGQEDAEKLNVNKFKEGFGGRVAAQYNTDRGVTLKGVLAVQLRRAVGVIRGHK